MHYLDFLTQLHAELHPRTYLEIGIRQGDSLSLSRCRSIGIDPNFEVSRELLAPTSLIRATSDDYFQGLGASGPFDGEPIDLAFIDGMHLFEFAVRDFSNVELNSASSTVVVFDDVLPRNSEEAARDRHTQAWTGDVFRILDVFTLLRPDLSLVIVDTQPTGLLLVTNLDPGNDALTKDFEGVVRTFVASDPQIIPREILERSEALTPASALALPVWRETASSRSHHNSDGPQDLRMRRVGFRRQRP
jgi:hypothetical protein